jgi:hypothetical protein
MWWMLWMFPSAFSSRSVIILHRWHTFCHRPLNLQLEREHNPNQQETRVTSNPCIFVSHGELSCLPSRSSHQQLLRIRSPAGTARITVDASTSGDELAKLILDTIPKDEDKPDPASLQLSNQPGGNGEKVGMDALRGRKVGDMGFR